MIEVGSYPQATIGMSLPQAYAHIFHSWQKFLEADQEARIKDPALPPLPEPSGVVDLSELPPHLIELTERLRDCGWCILHSHGFDVMGDIWEGLDTFPAVFAHGQLLAQWINWSWLGVGDWSC